MVALRARKEERARFTPFSRCDKTIAASLFITGFVFIDERTFRVKVSKKLTITLDYKMGNCVSDQQSKHETLKTSTVVELQTNAARQVWQGSFDDELSLRSVSSVKDQRNDVLSVRSVSSHSLRQRNSQNALSLRGVSSHSLRQRHSQAALSHRSVASQRVLRGSLTLQSLSTDDLNSTTLDLSFSDQGSIGESIHSLPSACTVHIDPDESRNCSSTSSFKNSECGQSNNQPNQSLPSVSESGYLDIEAFTRKVNDQLRNLSASATGRASKMGRAFSVIRRLDSAIVNAMSKVRNIRARTSSRVSPMLGNEGRHQTTPVSDDCSDVVFLSD